MDVDTNDELPPVRTLSRKQRRVLGVLVEKAFTTRDSYPLTLKALTTGCNQKSNRSPLTSFSEDEVLESLEELRELRLIGEVHTDGGRSSRYRHYMRKRFTFTEPQLAVITELLLRGRQTMGELRARASRMVPIDGLATLRTEMTGLLETAHVQASGALERRGIEVDHNFYEERESKHIMSAAPAAPSAPPAPNAPAVSASPAAAQPVAPAVATPAADNSVMQELQNQVEELTVMHEELANRVAELSSNLEQVARQAGIDI